jgi:hypothetical protein
MEREVGFLELLRLEKEQAEASGRTSASIRSRQKGHKKKLLKMHATWEAWRSFGQGEGAPLPVPVEEIMAGQYPWQPVLGESVSGESLRFALYKAVVELERTIECRCMMRIDALVLLAFFSYQRAVIVASVGQGGVISSGMASLLLGRLQQIGRLEADAHTRFRSKGLL